MGNAAVALAKAVGYSTAGTVEFITDQQRNFYFLEMNTRLQVEHAVTEMITGLDLVEWMIRIVNGERLTIQQQDVQLRGWAVETRVYAEDPNRGFMPSTGRLTRYRTPAEEADVRVDNGVFEGGEISRFYDPMIANVSTWGADREKAVQRMRMALDEFYIQGVSHNIAFLTALLANPRFLEGRLSTNFIPSEYPEGFTPAPLEPKDLNAIIGAATLMHLRYMERAARTSEQLPSYRFHIPEEWEVLVDGDFYPVTIQAMAEGFDITRENGQIIAVRSDWQVGDPVLGCTVNAHPERFKVRRSGLRPLPPGGGGPCAGLHPHRRAPGASDAGQGPAGHVHVPALAHARPLALHRRERGPELGFRRRAVRGRGDEDGEYPAYPPGGEDRQPQSTTRRHPDRRAGDPGVRIGGSSGRLRGSSRAASRTFATCTCWFSSKSLIAAQEKKLNRIPTLLLSLAALLSVIPRAVCASASGAEAIDLTGRAVAIAALAIFVVAHGLVMA
jgi:hypothetical protein